MTPTIALIRKNVSDSRWMLGILGVALFWFCWLFVFTAHIDEKRLKSPEGNFQRRFAQGIGANAMDFSSVALEMRWWTVQPLFFQMFSVWAISRGISAVGGEIEKGTMDLILSRPIARWSFLMAQILASTLGLAFMVLAMVVGHLFGAHFNSLETPPSVLLIAKAGFNLAMVNWAIYGYTFMLSAMDLVRWRPNLISAVATIGGFIALILPNFPVFEKYKWIEKFSVFRAFNPIEVVTRGETFAFNCGALGAVGGIGILVGFAVFSWRDIPAGS